MRNTDILLFQPGFLTQEVCYNYGGGETGGGNDNGGASDRPAPNREDEQTTPDREDEQNGQ